MYIQSTIHLVASLRTELGIGLKESLDLVHRLEDAQIERALDHGIDPPVESLVAYARRSAKRVNDAKKAERLAYAADYKVRANVPDTYTPDSARVIAGIYGDHAPRPILDQDDCPEF